jgi:hypothetical protein
MHTPPIGHTTFDINSHTALPTATAAAPAPAPSPAPTQSNFTADDGQSNATPNASKLKKKSSAETLAKRNFYNNPRRNTQKTAKADGAGQDESLAVELPPDPKANDGDTLELEVPKDEKNEEYMVKAREGWSDVISEAIHKHNKNIDYMPTLPQLLV